MYISSFVYHHFHTILNNDRLSFWFLFKLFWFITHTHTHTRKGHIKRNTCIEHEEKVNYETINRISSELNWCLQSNTTKSSCSIHNCPNISNYFLHWSMINHWSYNSIPPRSNWPSSPSTVESKARNGDRSKWGMKSDFSRKFYQTEGAILFIED